MKGKQLEFCEPQIETAEAEVPSVPLIQNKRTQHNSPQRPASRGLPGKTPPGLMFPQGSAGQGQPFCSSHSPAVSFPRPCSGRLQRPPGDTAEPSRAWGKARHPVLTVTCSTCFALGQQPHRGQELPNTNPAVTKLCRASRLSPASTPGRSQAVPLLLCRITSLLMELEPRPLPRAELQRWGAQQMDVFSSSGFRHSPPSFLPPLSHFRPGTVPTAHEKIMTGGETGKE